MARICTEVTIEIRLLTKCRKRDTIGLHKSRWRRTNKLRIRSECICIRWPLVHWGRSNLSKPHSISYDESMNQFFSTSLDHTKLAAIQLKCEEKKNISRSVAQKKYLCFTPATTRNTIWIITIIKWKIFLLHHRLIIIIITILFFCRRFEMGKRARTSNMIAHTQYLCIFSAGVYPVPLYKSFQFPIPFYRIHIHLQNWPLATISESLFSFFCYVPSTVNYYSAQCLYTPTDEHFGEERNVVDDRMNDRTDGN